MKSKLKEHFGNRIIQTESNGKTNVLTFRSTAKEEKKRIVETAAKLIKDDMKSAETSNDVYPDSDSLNSEEDASTFFKKASGFY